MSLNRFQIAYFIQRNKKKTPNFVYLRFGKKFNKKKSKPYKLNINVFKMKELNFF